MPLFDIPRSRWRTELRSHIALTLPGVLLKQSLGAANQGRRRSNDPKTTAAKPLLSNRSGYLPSLDGWRALAILGVLLTHDLPWTFAGPTFVSVQGYGGYGVQLFFAISGLLITTRIVSEEQKSGQFRIRAFYVRRLFRIQPAAIAYLSVIFVLILTKVAHEDWRSWLGALFLYSNFLYRSTDATANSAFTAHFWTLAVEEHFYILLSLMLLLVRKHRLIWLGVAITLLLLIQRVATEHGLYSLNVSSRRTYWVIQFLLIPAWLALLLRVPEVRDAVDRYLQPRVAFLASVLLVCASRLLMMVRHGESIATQFWSLRLLWEQHAIIWFSFSLWIIATMTHPRSWTTRVLELPPLRFLGRLSYSIYLWHVLFFIVVFPHVDVTWRPMVMLSHRPYKYIAAILVASLCYYLLERPMIRVGHRLAPPLTPGHRDLAAGPS